MTGRSPAGMAASLPARDRPGLAFLLGEGFIAPSPPGVLILDVKQELRNWPPVRRQEAHLLIEQRPDFREPGRWPDIGVEPRGTPSGHHELGKELITADKLPDAAALLMRRSCHRPGPRQASALCAPMSAQAITALCVCRAA